MTIRKRTTDISKDILASFKHEIKIVRKHPAKIINYEDYDKNSLLKCDVCSWQGTSKENIEGHKDLFDVSCPECGKMLLIVGYPANRD